MLGLNVFGAGHAFDAGLVAYLGLGVEDEGDWGLADAALGRSDDGDRVDWKAGVAGFVDLLLLSRFGLL